MKVDSSLIRRLSGFGFAQAADGYVVAIKSVDEIDGAFDLARHSGRKVTLRGAGKSYGDAAIGAENVVLDLTGLDNICSWDAESGLLEAEAGATLESIWKRTLPDGWWLPVVSGTTKTTLGGSLAMNIHGKNAFRCGNLGEHVRSLEVITPSGRLTLQPGDAHFHDFIGSAGQLGVITKAAIQMKQVASGKVRVHALSCSNWAEQFAAFQRFCPDADYVVSWIDAFAADSSSGRGLVHAAWHEDAANARSLLVASQDLPARILGAIPKNQVWRILKLLNHRAGVRLLNAVKHFVAKKLEHNRVNSQSLAEFNFLLDYVPGWEKSYRPRGLIQCQVFVPEELAQRAFREILEHCRDAGQEPFLAVMKKHRSSDAFWLFSHQIDGYSLALDFKVRQGTFELGRQLYDLALQHGAKFYFAKDSVLKRAQVEQCFGSDFIRLAQLKSAFDPEGLLTSDLAKRCFQDKGA